MDELIEILKQYGFNIEYEIDGQICMVDRDYKNRVGIYIIPPHEANNMNWIIRMDYMDEFDKWGNAHYEQSFKRLGKKSIHNIINDFKYMKTRKMKS